MAFIGGVISTGSIPKALWPGVKGWWGRFYEEHEKQYPQLFEERDSDMAYEELVEVTGFGLAPVKPQGAAIEYDSEDQQTVSRFNNIAYALGFIVTWEEMRDNLYEKVARRRTQALAWSMRQTKENVCANVYNHGFDSAYAGGDGAAMLSTSHPSLAGNQSNILPVSADFSEASLEDLCIQIANTVNVRGLKIDIKPKSLVIPTSLMFEATRVLKSVLQNDTANNAVNALKVMNSIPDGQVVNNYLTDTDAWFVRTDCPESLILFNRDPMMFEQDNDGDTKNIKYNAYERYVPKWGDWRGIYGSAGA